MFQFLGLLLDDEKHVHKGNAHQQGNESEQPLVGDGTSKADACPAEANNEVDEVLDALTVQVL